ncbi:hypothetical protein [Dasania marina]|uniref:hypothetical protein n=1 Tax=Dasania marina TaxID=471499 RepID=UPI0030D93364|tara:strand:- start:59555 stop:60370 length:816 start_codon:yes stop_codon:yes gene_type:complete
MFATGKNKLESVDKDNVLGQMTAEDFATFFRNGWQQGVIIKDDGKVDSRQVDINGQQYFAKCYSFSGAFAAWCFNKGIHKYNRMLSIARLMYLCGVQVPRLLRVLNDVAARKLYVVYTYEAGGKDLRCLIGEKLNCHFDEHNISEKIAGQMALLHGKAHVLHGDFKWANILYDESTHRIILVDIDGARKLSASSKGFCRDVARFILDCEEAGLSHDRVRRVLVVYAEKTGQQYDAVEAGINKYYIRLKQRHDNQYGKDFKLSNPYKSNGPS